MQKFQEISQLIWNVADDVLRGVFKPFEYGDIVLPFVVLRRLDCMLEPQKDKVIQLYADLKKDKIDDPYPIIRKKTGLNFYNHSKYDLVRLKSDPNKLKMNWQNYISGFSQNVYDIIENFQFDKPVEKLLKNNKLYLLIDKMTEVDLHPKVLDNHMMGQIFEELLRRFSEARAEESGQFYTPRDLVRLLVSLTFEGSKDDLSGEGVIRSIYDCCAGSGGILTISKEYVLENLSPKVKINLFGQELNTQTYSICKSDFLITGENPDNIKLGNTLTDDEFTGKKFDYLLTNPPFGVSWKGEQEFILSEAENPNGRFSVGTPRVSDGSLLFLQHMISKMKPEGSKIGIIFNGSPLFTGDAGSGESEIRRWVLENDWLEAIVQLPDQLFFNTGITTYIWVLNNNKKKNRKGKVQLIDASSFFKQMKKSLGSKRKEVTNEDRERILKIYKDLKEGEYCKIYPTEFFGYTKITIEQPLLEKGKRVLDKHGNQKPDSSLRDNERVPLGEDIDEYFEREVKPHVPNAWVDESKSQVGYEINFTKYFYKYKPLRSLKEITDDLMKLEKESDGLMSKILQA